jgi:hypothetical protein
LWRWNKPTMPILRLLLGRPSNVFFSWAGAFLGGIFFLACAVAVDENEWRGEGRRRKQKRGLVEEHANRLGIIIEGCRSEKLGRTDFLTSPNDKAAVRHKFGSELFSRPCTRTPSLSRAFLVLLPPPSHRPYRTRRVQYDASGNPPLCSSLRFGGNGTDSDCRGCVSGLSTVAVLPTIETDAVLQTYCSAGQTVVQVVTVDPVAGIPTTQTLQTLTLIPTSTTIVNACVLCIGIAAHIG